MSTIGSTPPPITTTGFDPAGGQVSLELQRQGLLQADAGLAIADAAPAALVDAGETVLNLSAWSDTDPSRGLPRADGLEGRLGALDRSTAANTGVDEIFAAL